LKGAAASFAKVTAAARRPEVRITKKMSLKDVSKLTLTRLRAMVSRERARAADLEAKRIALRAQNLDLQATSDELKAKNDALVRKTDALQRRVHYLEDIKDWQHSCLVTKGKPAPTVLRRGRKSER
jgi:hypothetical protein